MHVEKPAINCVASDDGTITMQDNIIDEYKWYMIGELGDVVRPVSLFISKMEATKRVKSYLVHPMTSGLLHPTNKLVHVLRLMYKHGVLHVELFVEYDDLGIEVQEVRIVLHNENIRRSQDGEREGHTEDLLIYTIHDPRFKLMNYIGCSVKRKGCAELYLRENYKADWSPSAAEKAFKNSTPPARDDDVVEVDEDSTSMGHVSPTQAPEVPPMFKKVRKLFFSVSMYA